MIKLTKRFVLETINAKILENVQALKLLDKNRKTLVLVFRCWHYKNKRTKSAEIV